MFSVPSPPPKKEKNELKLYDLLYIAIPKILILTVPNFPGDDYY